MIYFIALATFCITLLGGFFAVRFKDKLHLILGFSAGAIIGVALFDLIPESLDISKGIWSTSTVMLIVAVGFSLYMIIERSLFPKCIEEDHHHRGRFGAGSLSAHSFLDGVAIGVSFGVSQTVGLIVAVAVLAHDFSDGINTASMILRHGGKRNEALKWVVTDAIAPVLGILFTQLFKISQANIALLVALFAGFFLYIGASDLLPESHHNHPTRWTTIMTICGISFIYFVVLFA